MPSLATIRDKGEADMRAMLVKLSDKQRVKIGRQIRKHGSVEAVPQEFWARLQREVEEEEAAALLLLLLAADEWTTDRIRRQGVDTGGVRGGQLADYGRIAGARAQLFGQQWVQTTRDSLVSKERETGVVRPADVADTLSTDRIERASITQTTTSISDGQLGARSRAGDEAGRRAPPDDVQAVEIDMIWITELDDRVCPICRPLHRTTEEVWGRQFPQGPPAHVNCRCHLVPKVSVSRAA